MKLIFAILLAAVLAGCQAVPTKVTETQKREFDILVDKTQKPIELSDKTVVLDSRSSFNYGLNRIANSLHFTWDQLAETTASGEVLRDLRKAALRLSLNGLEPHTPVVVVGDDHGAMGRLAWSLLYLGFQDVQVASNEMFRKSFTQNPSAAAKNVPVWPVNPREELQIGKSEFVQLSQNPKGRLENRIFIIDVRTGDEYFNKVQPKGAKAPDIHALHMPLAEFFTAKGRPSAAVRAKLQSVGIQPGDRVILISNKGVRSGAAAYVLLALGYSRVQNFTGGWNSLLTDRL